MDRPHRPPLLPLLYWWQTNAYSIAETESDTDAQCLSPLWLLSPIWFQIEGATSYLRKNSYRLQRYPSWLP